MAPQVLFLNPHCGTPIRDAHLAGFRRYATARGWETVFAEGPVLSAARAARLVARTKPIGVALDLTGGLPSFSESVFGDIPVVRLSAQTPHGELHGALVRSDGAAVVRLAFHELSSGRPSAFAVFPHPDGAEWSECRVEAFRALATAAGAPCHVFRHDRRDRDPCGRRSGEEPPSAAAARLPRLAQWCASLPRGCAVFAVNDPSAAEVLGACRAAGLSVPRDLTLLGVDNCALCDKLSPGLTSVVMDHERAGFITGRALDTLLTGGKTPVIEQFGPITVVRRDSTRGVSRGTPAVMTAIEIIRREAVTGLNAADLAARVPGSRRLFELRFREAVGHSPLEEIHGVRLETVQALLARADMPLCAVYAFSGFPSHLALHRLFKRRTGMTMSQWRRRHFG